MATNTITVAAGQTSQPVPVGKDTVVSVTPGSGGRALLEYTYGSEVDQRNGVARWFPWVHGSVSVATSDVINGKGYVRLTAYTASASASVEAGVDAQVARTLVQDQSFSGGARGFLNKPNTCILFGSSSMAHNHYVNGVEEGYYGRGMVVQALQQLGWPLRIIRNSGRSGERARDAYARLKEDCIQYQPGYAFVLMGHNDITAGATGDEAFAWVKLTLDEMIANNITPIAINLFGTGFVTTPAMFDALCRFNHLLRQYALDNPVIHIDMYSGTLNFATGQAKTGITWDNHHRNSAGGQLGGDIIAAHLAGRFTPNWPISSPFDFTNIAPNPGLLGANVSGQNGYTSSGFSSSSGPHAMAATASGATSATIATAARADGRVGQVVTMALTSSGSPGSITVQFSLPLDTAWATGTAYTIGTVRRPTTANGFIYRCETGGTSHASTEPTWPTTLGHTVTDNGVVWRCLEKPLPGQVWEMESEFIDVSLSGSGRISTRILCSNSVPSTLKQFHSNFILISDSGEAYPTSLPSRVHHKTPEFVIPANTANMTLVVVLSGMNGTVISAGLAALALRRIS